MLLPQTEEQSTSENQTNLNGGKDSQSINTNSEPKNPSYVTILSIWNTMIGSSTVTMPNCVANAGLIPTLRNLFHNF